jgi:hypothetical protein
MVDSSPELAMKALERRTRLSIFGGQPKAKIGRRSAQGRVFNRRNTERNVQTAAGVVAPSQPSNSGVSLFGVDPGIEE